MSNKFQEMVRLNLTCFSANEVSFCDPLEDLRSISSLSFGMLRFGDFGGSMVTFVYTDLPF